jgi:uncharacterized protein (TIGR00725 family)
MARQPWIGVIGPGKPDTDGRYELDALTGLAVDVGQLLAACGAVVINGGLGGVMEAVSFGASGEGRGGESWGLLPTDDLSLANPYLTRRIPTGVGEGRNFVLVGMSDALIAIGENPGTRIEIRRAEQLGKPVFGLNHPPRRRISGTSRVLSPDRAVQRAIGVAVKLGSGA